MASRIYRFGMTPAVRRFASACIMGCVLLSCYTIFADAPSIPAEATGGAVTLATILLIFAFFAGISQWVARPAALEAATKAIESHEKKGSDAHPTLVSRDDHARVILTLNEMNGRLERLLGRLEND